MLHWTDKDHFYRVVLSSRFQEIELWKPRGGFLHVAKADVAVGKSMALEATTQVGKLEVKLDGKFVLSHRDTLEPLAGGRHGLAVFRSQSRFGPTQVQRLDSVTLKTPAPHNSNN